MVRMHITQKKSEEFMNKINILVTGTGSLICQAIIKSIKQSSLKDDIYIVGYDYFPETVGSFWCDKNYILPDILKPENKDNWQEQIFDIIKRDNISLLFIGLDFELILFAELKEKIESQTKCKVIVADKKVLTIGNDKYLTAQFLKENGLNYPKTYLIDEFKDGYIDYPCILKPRVGARSKGVSIINSKEELYKKANIVEGAIVQELIGNKDSEYTCGILYLDNKLISSIALKRVLKEGNTHLARFNKNFSPKIYDYLNEIAHKLKPYGSCNLQLRTDEKGEPFLFEINPRFSGTTYIRSLFGYKEVEYIIKYLLGMSNESFELIEGTVCRYYEEKLV